MYNKFDFLCPLIEQVSDRAFRHMYMTGEHSKSCTLTLKKEISSSECSLLHYLL